jgi:predicted ATPase/DNA-binding SARP family transcriptional activator/Tfp pilus assembly protein PilF
MTRQSARLRSNSLCIYLLGSFRIERGKRTIHLPTRKMESLFAYLVLHPDAHPREKIAALFWGDYPDARARNSLRNALTVLRAHFGYDLIHADREVVQLNRAAPLWVDGIEFEAWAKRFLTQGLIDQDAVHIDLYQGELLAGFYEDWIIAARERYHALNIDALLRLTQEMRSQSEYGQAVEYARRVLAVDRANERAHQHLMFCYLAMGDRISALRQYEECRRALREELSVKPAPETTALCHWIRQTSAVGQANVTRVTNLPVPISSFIGRAREMRQVKQCLSETRLLTLTGAGGSGKTRLAVQAATDLIDEFKDGVWWTEFGALTDERLVLSSVAKTLGVQERIDESPLDMLRHVLRDKKLLLVLDNCEHLIESCARLSEQLLRACPDLKILATSREALGIIGEQIFPVPTLSFPESDDRLSLPMTYESVRLFTERARAVKTDFRLNDKNARAILQICRRLDGIPLAIELAAARVQALTVEEIAARLDDRFNLLMVGNRTALPRHQTLRALNDWSYDLLCEEEQILFRRLAVFRGGRTQQAVQAVCSGKGIASERVSDLLARLVDRSLLVAEERNGATHYRFLETIREYAREKLDASSEGTWLHDRHLDFFLNLAEAAEPDLIGAAQAQRLAQLEAELGNLRVALAWSDANESRREQCLRLNAALRRFWEARGGLTEGRRWLERALAQDASAVDPRVRLRAVLAAGALAGVQSDYAAARAWLQESETIARTLSDQRSLGYALAYRGWVSIRQGDLEGARIQLDEGKNLLQQADDRWGLVYALSHLVNVTRNQGDYASAHRYYKQAQLYRSGLHDKRLVATLLTSYGELLRCEGDYVQAEKIYEESLALSEDVGDKRGQALALHNLGYVARHEDELARAAGYFKKSMEFYRGSNDERGAALCVLGLAAVAQSRGRIERGTRLLSAAKAILDSIGATLSAADRIEFEQTAAAIRRVLSEEDLAAAWVEGKKLTLDQAIELALNET